VPKVPLHLLYSHIIHWFTHLSDISDVKISCVNVARDPIFDPRIYDEHQRKATNKLQNTSTIDHTRSSSDAIRKVAQQRGTSTEWFDYINISPIATPAVPLECTVQSSKEEHEQS
jgi:hypothetical protein